MRHAIPKAISAEDQSGLARETSEEAGSVKHERLYHVLLYITAIDYCIQAVDVTDCHVIMKWTPLYVYSSMNPCPETVCPPSVEFEFLTILKMANLTVLIKKELECRNRFGYYQVHTYTLWGDRSWSGDIKGQLRELPFVWEEFTTHPR